MHKAKIDVMVDTNVSIGDRIRITVNIDFPWHAISWKGESYPEEHGFTLPEEDFSV